MLLDKHLLLSGPVHRVIELRLSPNLNNAAKNLELHFDLAFLFQAVVKDLQLKIPILDWSSMDEFDQYSFFQELLVTDRTQGFEFSSPPLFRVILIRLKEKGFRCLWTFHHALLDGWSVNLIQREITKTYMKNSDHKRGERTKQRDELMNSS